MHYVYLLRSQKDPSQTYIGFSNNIRERIAVHNRGGSPHTSKFAPWELETYLAFSSKKKARDFEAYLKSHSGKAFSRKRLWNTPE